MHNPHHVKIHKHLLVFRNSFWKHIEDILYNMDNTNPCINLQNLRIIDTEKYMLIFYITFFLFFTGKFKKYSYLLGNILCSAWYTGAKLGWNWRCHLFCADNFTVGNEAVFPAVLGFSMQHFVRQWTLSSLPNIFGGGPFRRGRFGAGQLGAVPFRRRTFERRFLIFFFFDLWKKTMKQAIPWMPLSANLFRLEFSILTRAKQATNRNNIATEKQIWKKKFWRR